MQWCKVRSALDLQTTQLEEMRQRREMKGVEDLGDRDDDFKDIFVVGGVCAFEGKYLVERMPLGRIKPRIVHLLIHEDHDRKVAGGLLFEFVVSITEIICASHCDVAEGEVERSRMLWSERRF